MPRGQPRPLFARRPRPHDGLAGADAIAAARQRRDGGHAGRGDRRRGRGQRGDWPRTPAASRCATRTISGPAPRGWPTSRGPTTCSATRRPRARAPRDWRKLKVEVDRPDLKVRARKGYTLRTPRRSPRRRTPDGRRRPRRARARRSNGSALEPASADRRRPGPGQRARRRCDSAPRHGLRSRGAARGHGAHRPGGRDRHRSLANLGGEERPQPS